MEKQQLIDKRDELRARLQAIQADYRKGLSADSEEQVTELENRDVMAEIARTTAEELERIEKLLSESGD